MGAPALTTLAPRTPNAPKKGESPRLCTLLELVQAVSDVTDDEREVTATISYMLRSGRVRLCGCLRDEAVSQWLR